MNDEIDGQIRESTYEPPAVIYRERLEFMAATCTPVPPGKSTVETCPSGPIAS